MALNLSIIKSPAGITLEITQKTFSEEGGTIGRGEGNDWVLKDPDRFLSSRHCGLGFEGGQYYLTDMSTNGTFINGAPEPLGKGGKIPLNDGDTIEVGDYQFRTELSMGHDLGNDPFIGSQTTPEIRAPEPDPFAAAPHSQNFEDPFAASEVSLNPDPANVDPLAALDKMNLPESNAGFSSSDSVLADPQPSRDLYGLAGRAAADAFSSSESHNDGAGALDQAVDWPDVKNESVIPEDWDDDLLGDSSPSCSHFPEDKVSSTPLTATGPPIVETKHKAPSSLDVSAEHRSMPLTDPPKVPRTPGPRAAILEEPLLSERRPEPVEIFAPKDTNKHEQKAPRQTAEKSLQKLGTNTAIGDAVLKGLGVSDKKLSDEQVADIHTVVGQLMPVIIEGMMQVLRSRASIKNEFRMNVTTIQPIENNPLKFSANAGEAIDNMFVRQSNAYMAPEEAFQEGFDSIGEHQVAIIAGIRAAFKSMMDRFDPDLLQRQFDKQNKGVVLPGMQRSKYWNSYVDYYNSFVDNMENTFQYLFGDEFVQAYEDQLRRLAVERKQRQKLDQ